MKIKIILSALFIILFHSFILSADKSSNHEYDYFNLKAQGLYFEALEALTPHILESEDPAEIETGIFRIKELMLYPELFSPAKDVLEKILTLDAVKKNPDLIARAGIVLNRIYLAGGDIDASESMINRSGYLDFKITGPFSAVSATEFEVDNPAMHGYDPDKRYAGRHYETGWFNAVSDREGTINADNFISDTSDSYVILFRDIYVPENGEYTVHIGKTGFTDVVIEGDRVFSDRSRHGFHHDQYEVKLKFHEGRHRIFVKTADSDDGIRFSMRMTDSKGRPVDSALEGDIRAASPPEIVSTGYFSTLENYIADAEKGSEPSFRAGYIFIRAGLAHEEKAIPLELLSAVERDHFLYPFANFYIARTETSKEVSEKYLRNSIETNSRYIEALVEKIQIKIDAGFLYEAYSLIEQIHEISPRSHYYNLMLVKFHHKRGWFLEALKEIRRGEDGDYPSSVRGYSAAFKNERGLYYEQADPLRKLYQADRYDDQVLSDLVTSLRRSGREGEGMNLLWQAAAMFPDNVQVRLEMARISADDAGPGSSLRHISSAQRISPFNKDLFRALGIAYDRMGRVETAREYLKLSSFYDPDNFEIKRYISLLSEEDFRAHDFAYPPDITPLIQEAAEYSGEPAVILLQENVTEVNPDGSYTRNVRNVYRINDSGHAEEFEYQYIVFDPQVEHPENIRCVVIKNGKASEVTSMYRRSLSDPEARLYYNLEAIVIPVEVDADTVIDFSYTMKNRGGAVFRHYFGSRIIKGSHYRTLKSNTILTHPEARDINFYTRDIDSAYITEDRLERGRLISIKLNNIEPYKEEPAMPHRTEVRPSVYFSSFETWDDLASYYRNLMQNRVRVTTSMKDHIESLVSPDDGDAEIVRKLYNLVTSRIRYVGFEFTLGAIQPGSTDETFRSGMGDCKDSALLLAAMLREAGVEARIALVRTRDRGEGDFSIPFLGTFNHALCYVKLDSGEELFLDTTTRHHSYRELPDQNRGVRALVIDDRPDVPFTEGRGWFFRKTDVDSYEKEYERIDTQITFEDEGRAFLDRRLVKYGTPAASLRESLLDSRRKSISLNEYWGRLFPGSAVSGLEIDSYEKDKPVDYSYSISVPSFYSLSGDDMIIFYAFLNQSDLYDNFAALTERSFPLVLGRRSVTEMHNEFIIPEGYRVILPDSGSMEIAAMKAEFGFSSDSNVINVYSRVEYKDYIIDVENYPDFRRMAEFIQTSTSQRIVLIKEE